MRSTFRTPSLSDFDASPEQGFLPPDPREHVPDCAALDDLGQALPKLLSARKVRSYIDGQPRLVSAFPPSWEDPDYRAAMRILSFAGHAYIWETPEHPADALPPQLAQPWYDVAQRVGRPPVLSYASYALDNWRRLDASQPIALDNIYMIQNVLAGQDEAWFVLVHVAIEARAGEMLSLIPVLVEAADRGDAKAVEQNLARVNRVWDDVNAIFDRMPERCDPYIYFHRVRPYIHGWANNPALGEGLIY